MYKLSPVFQVPVRKIDVGNYEYDGTDVAMAVRITRDYATKGVLPAPLIVKRTKNGCYKVRSGVPSLIVAHTLGIESVGCQEVILDESDPGVREEGTSAGSVCCP